MVKSHAQPLAKLTIDSERDFFNARTFIAGLHGHGERGGGTKGDDRDTGVGDLYDGPDIVDCRAAWRREKGQRQQDRGERVHPLASAGSR